MEVKNPPNEVTTMKNKLLWILTAIPLLVTGLVLPAFPERVPMHYDIHGNIDRWGSKYEQLIFPILIVMFSVFWHFFCNHFHKKAEKLGDSKEGREAASNGKVIYFTAVGTTLMFTVMNCVFLISAYNEAKTAATVASIDINSIVGVLMGLLLIATGSFMPKTRINPVVGFRTKKTMSSEENWAKANRFAGKVFVISGLLIVALSLMFGGITAMSCFLGVLFADVVICLIYSAKLPS